MQALRVDVWSDIACPWCYVGKRRLEAALEKFPHDVELTFHSFELDPNAPRVLEGDYVERLAKKYRVPTSQAQQMIDRMTQTGEADGIEMNFDLVRGGNTFDAHRLLHYAREGGLQVLLKERLMRGYFTEGVAIGDPDALVPLAVEAGLGEREVRDVLGSERYTSNVREDELVAQELGITGVPFFVFGGRIGVSGAQTADVLLDALEQALAETLAEAQPST